MSETDALTNEMLLKGFPAKVTVMVCSEDGIPVPEANVQFVFTVFNQRNPHIYKTMTDTNGFASGEGLCNDTIVIRVTKDGYYRRSLRYNLWKQNGRSYQKGRWEPWNSRIPVTLKKCLNPKTGSVHRLSVRNLQQGEKYGVDLVVGDLVEPNGSGKHADFNIVFIFEMLPNENFNFQAKASLCANESNGFVRAAKDNQCSMHYAVQAPVEGYTNRLDFIQIVQNKTRINTFPHNSEEYFAFRVQRKNDEKESETHYGIIRSIGFDPDNNKSTFTFQCEFYFNEERDDRGTEYVE